ncbi:NADP-dependent oxidoreductase domain-containing protein [Xylaria bambusicola]|uniref:NADP-dependent oxidoreductase domain-containing protein n=1 Tax=Xylaria bambusicola TaxID=326684 RepID=UPI00200760DF|nr:NADP-dependent oxidoreductase domain-containing protein [Xylaria bambusicola]KAI0527996.1 NADP-dependent oxidoreductase domain-containing protein [Xylaria bambusicola]
MKATISQFATVPDALRRSVSLSRACYRRLGNSGLRVSNPILGGAHLGSSRWLPWALEEEQALKVLKAAYDRGINTWDTANAYSNGESERIMGKALKKYNIPRSKVVLMTKCFRVVCDPEQYDPGSSVYMHHDIADTSKDYVNQWGLSRTGIFNAVEASLERLDTTYIDLLHIHRFDPTVPPEETMCALHDLVKENKVRYIGASSMWAHQFAILQHTAEKHGWTKFISMQNHYNLLYREEEREMNPYCKLTGVGTLAWAPLAGGRLARPQTQAPTSIRTVHTKNGGFYEQGDDMSSANIISRAAEIAEKRGWPLSHVGLAWLNRRTVAPVIGFSSPERMDEALDALGKELTAEEEESLEALYQPRKVQGHS